MAGKRSLRLASASAPSSSSRQKSSSKSTTRRASSTAHDDDSFSDFDSKLSDTGARGAKRRKVAPAPRARKEKASIPHASLFTNCGIVSQEPCSPSGRPHSLSYHQPLLLCASHGKNHRRALLSWFDSVSTTRAMPWRRAWINPRREPDAGKLRTALERRAYEVWISEIMLQQTRVAVVIDYWNRWMDTWPSVHHLAAADPEDVLAAWRGLGYYSRATRIHEAAKLVVQDPDMQGLLPSHVGALEARVPGVGRYTAGAISAIVFGRAAPMVDGNVLRVLSRQLGIYGNIKTDKKVVDAIWAAAEALVQAVARDSPNKDEGEDEDEHDEADVSDRPGRWGQALMELGSTVCTPKPNCAACPITASCRVHSEAAATSRKTQHVADIEDACTLCEPFEEDVDAGDAATTNTALQESRAKANSTDKDKKKGPRQMTLSAFAFTGKSTTGPPANDNESKRDKARNSEARQEAIANYARKFPLKVAKKAVRQEDSLVCAVQRADGSYLVHRRPEKGLLAGLWEFPSRTLLPDGDEYNTVVQRSRLARAHVESLFGGRPPEHVGELGSVPWLFSHLRLTMHVHLFRFRGDDCDAEGADMGDRARWSRDVEAESMGTGMRKCWALVRDADADADG